MKAAFWLFIGLVVGMTGMVYLALYLIGKQGV